jgi:hypothetical protein
LFAAELTYFNTARRLTRPVAFAAGRFLLPADVSAVTQVARPIHHSLAYHGLSFQVDFVN